MTGAPRVAVVGGGIAGLAAGLRLRERLGPGARITLVEQADRLGGKLYTGELAGQPVERGAESFLMRDPRTGGPSAAVQLVERVGLGEALRYPALVPAALAVDDRLCPIPAGTLMGVPADPAGLGDLATATDADRDAGRPLLRPDQDVAVGALVRSRLGDAVVDRLVDPLLGGVYAGHADTLSLAATMPALAAAARIEHTLTGAVRSALRSRPPGGGPVFATVDGGLSRLVGAVAGAADLEIRLGRPVRSLERTATGWRLDGAEVDGVVLAVPARPAARLLAGSSPAAAAEIGALDYASVALVTLALPADAKLPDLSGFLVPAGQGFAIKALTIFTTKWPHLASGRSVLVRASIGRYGEVHELRRGDHELINLARGEISHIFGTPLAGPLAAGVSRWGGALPQYAPGHLDRVARARSALAGARLALAGAAYDGIGIPVCVRSGWAAADLVLDDVPVGEELT